MISLKQQKIFWRYAIIEKKPSTIMLLLTNLIALIGIIIFSANYVELFIAYIFQSIIISIFYFKKLKDRSKYSTKGIYFHDYSFSSRHDQIRRYKSSQLKWFIFVELMILILFFIFSGLFEIIDLILNGVTIGVIPLIVIYYFSYKVNKGKEFEIYQDLYSCTALGMKRNSIIVLLAFIGLCIMTYLNILILIALVIIIKIYFDILMHEIEHYNHKLMESTI